MATTNQFTKGINDDVHPKYQPEGTYRWAYNAVLETEEGDIPSISNELGTEVCASLPTNTTIIGHALTDTTDIVVFLYHSDPSRPDHEIGIYNPLNCSYTTIVKDQLLNFSNQHPINAVVRIKNGCDRYLYFTDNYNRYRVVNITDTSEWVNPANKALLSEDKLYLSRDTGLHTKVVLAANSGEFVLSGGGELEHGAYSFYYRNLDADLNATNEWLPLTNYISVGHGLQSNSDSTLLVGADNVESSPTFEQKANKSIRLPLQSLNNQFKYYQIAVVKRTALGGSISGVDILFPQEILGSTDTFIYTGKQDQVFEESSIDAILVPTKYIAKVKSHVIDDNRLFLAGHSKDARDYSEYQKYASKIKVTYKSDAVTSRNSGDSFNHVYSITVCPDEIYSLGIVWVHADEESPVFPLIGRAANIADIDGDHFNPYIPSHTNWDTDDITGDANIFNPAKTKRWQVYSTATIDTTVSTNDTHTGHLGYHECETATYPDMEYCGTHADGYWGRDWNNNLIEPGVTKIRHFRMPPQWLYNQAQVPETADNPQYTIHLQFDNVEFPNSDVIGYYFVYGDRTTERTVLDRGTIQPMSYSYTTESFYHSYPDWDGVVFTKSGDKATMVHNAFISPRTLYSNYPTEGDYISIEKQLDDVESNALSVVKSVTGGLDVPEFSATLNFSSRIFNYTTFTQPENRINYPIVSSNFLVKSPVLSGNDNDPNSSNPIFATNTNRDRIENRSRNNDVLHIELDSHLEEIDAVTLSATDPTSVAPEVRFRHLLATVKADKDIFTNLFNIKYKKLSPAIHTTQLSEFHVTGGDQFIPYMDITDFYWTTGDVYAHHTTTPVTHDINLGFRYFSDVDRGLYTWYQHADNYDHTAFLKYFISKYYELSAGDPLFYTEFYGINDAYSYLAPDKIYYPFPFNYDACDTCREDAPYRVHYSEQDFTEGSVDKLRIFYENNYKDIDGTTGVITDIFKSFDQVYLTTNYAPYLVPTRPQQISANEGSIYVGTGEVLSLPFRKLTSADFALSGMLTFKDKVNTEFGTVYIDHFSSQPVILTDRPNSISAGRRNWWQRNGELKLYNQFKKLTNLDYPVLSTPSSVGIGYSLAYDPRYKRVIVHKKDYKIKPQYENVFVYSPTASISDAGKLWFNGTSYYYNRTASITDKIELDNSEYFTDESFTVSYSFLTNNWISHHSYQPYYMMNDYDTFYSDGFHKHNYGPHQTYYGNKEVHIIDLIATQNPNLSELTTNVFYNSLCREYDNTNEYYKNASYTYDSFIGYNSHQTTGLQQVLLKDTAFTMDTSNSSMFVDKTDQKYKINNLRDLSISATESLWTKDNTLDKVPNTNNINTGKSLFEQERFRDNYFGLRFYFNPPKDLKITTDIINTITANRNR